LDRYRFLTVLQHGCCKHMHVVIRHSLLLTVMTLLLLAGCDSLPRINPDLAMRPSHPIQLEGAHGPLSNQQSKAILARLKRGADDTNIFDRHLALVQEIGGSPLVVGNKVELLADGPSTYDSMFVAINAAKDHINMETYILEQDEIGQSLVDALLVKQRAGVQVNLIYDSVGSLSTPKPFFQPLIDVGANVLEYNPINPLKTRRDWQLNERDHRKLLVVDGKIAYVGGINISSVYSSGSFGSLFSRGTPGKKADQKKDGLSWRDTHLRMEGPVVAEFQKLFMSTWEKQKGNALGGREYYPQLSNMGREVVRAIGSSPGDPYSLIYVTLISAINSAESQVYITNAYFIPDPQLLAALKDTAARGVDVRLLLPGKSDSDLVFYVSRSFYQELLSSGVKIYERQEVLLHSKTAMIDGVWSTVGSTNLDWRSFLHNQEIDAVILGQDFGRRMQAMFEQDLQSSKQITLEDWKNRSLILRLKEAGARLWARLL
jgi:cardiolipin synthase